jgi:hypothetical protein
MKGWRMDHSIVLGADPSPLATVLADRPDQESLKGVSRILRGFNRQLGQLNYRIARI